ncbi:uncharacterized protein [Venturia canescens]|uniref:uncharacterized protein n=1 Tax=Venturia canescens TaxID=32260 RepID=UPI001C9CAD81|nr:uncharacterized protein LOC122412246 [Venturia canescens]
MDKNSLKIVLGICFCLTLVSSETPDCKCPGPVAHYEELGCTPVFEKPGDCCAQKYDCSKLKSLPTHKCVINDHEYEIGEHLKDEDANPCDIGCFCADGPGGPRFTCAIVDCFHGPVTPGCYLPHNATDCCAGPEVCPAKDEDRATCIVDGKTYRDGEYFEPAGEPHKSCYCAAGYAGENVEPFCVTLKHPCGIMLHHADVIRENCVPTYYFNQSPQTDCSVAYRCQNEKDAVIPKPAGEAKSATDATADPDMQCTFGNLTMQLGDELTQATDYSSVCVKCLCEVPPLPTCQRLSDEECDVTKHPNFDSR